MVGEAVASDTCCQCCKTFLEDNLNYSPAKLKQQELAILNSYPLV